MVFCSKTPALLDGSLQCGDEIVAINGTNVKGYYVKRLSI